MLRQPPAGRGKATGRVPGLRAHLAHLLSPGWHSAHGDRLGTRAEHNWANGSRKGTDEGQVNASVVGTRVALNVLVRKGKRTGSGSSCHWEKIYQFFRKRFFLATILGKLYVTEHPGGQPRVGRRPLGLGGHAPGRGPGRHADPGPGKRAALWGDRRVSSGPGRELRRGPRTRRGRQGL